MQTKRVDNKASAKERGGAGREPCGLRNSELGSLPHIKRTCFLKELFFHFFYKKTALTPLQAERFNLNLGRSAKDHAVVVELVDTLA